MVYTVQESFSYITFYVRMMFFTKTVHSKAWCYKKSILEMLVSYYCRYGVKKKKSKEACFKACSHFWGQRETTFSCFKNNSECTENYTCLGCDNKFGKRWLFEGNDNIVPKKRFREKLHYHKKDSTEDYLLHYWMEIVQEMWSDLENVIWNWSNFCLWL